MNENMDKFRRGRLKSVRNIQGSERSMTGKQCHMEDENATARPTLYRTQSVFIRSHDEVKAMSQVQRIRVRVKGFCKRIFCHLNNIHNSARSLSRLSSTGLVMADAEYPPQYRLQATTTIKKRSSIGRILHCLCGSASYSETAGIGFTHNRGLARALHWMFRVNFVLLFTVMCAGFVVLTLVFAAFIILAGRVNSESIRFGGESFGNSTSRFADAFSLSWTTFSTVGYGNAYPALGYQSQHPSNGLFITFLCSLESFLGVIYAGFCGAILFGKVMRIQSYAQVYFSDPIVIRYGRGVEEPAEDNESIGDDIGNKMIPCPVLEFRIVNRLFGDVGGEIMDAKLNVVANIDANDAEESSRGGLSAGDLSSYEATRALSSSITSQGEMFPDPDRLSNDSTHKFGRMRASFLESVLLKRQHHSVDEDPSSKFVKKRIYFKMAIEASEHPFFKHVWVGRHTLDETSPILRSKVRRQIRRKHGFWPERLNNYQAVRESLEFNQILVSLNGVSHVSASDVCAQKIYDCVDICVGYKFVNILYRDADGSLKVDTDLVNDVREQEGGGGEPLIL